MGSISSARVALVLAASALALVAGGPLVLAQDRAAQDVAPLAQQGAELSPSDESLAGWFGGSVALSADGKTALISGSGDGGGAGAVWLFTRSGSKWRQRGPKLTSGEDGTHAFGQSVSLSADGRTALIGGQSADGHGAAWVLTRSGSGWRWGAKLTGRGETADSDFGSSVALSGDGETALVGGAFDAGETGAAWVFARSGSTWKQQGEKLTGGGESPGGLFGGSVALSADGDTALIGIWNGNRASGAAWVFTRSGSTWTQQGPKLAAGGKRSGFGSTVALAADGNTALIGAEDAAAAWVFTRADATWAPEGKLSPAGKRGGNVSSAALSADGSTALIGNDFSGGVWGFTRSGTKWARHGAALTGRNQVGLSDFGSSMALSADGRIGLIGSQFDDDSTGAAWAFARTASGWSQQGPKLTGSGEASSSRFGWNVALSGDGNTALVGGPYDSHETGAAWVFVRVGSTWRQQGKKLTAGGSSAGSQSRFGWSVSLSADGNTALIGAPQDELKLSGGAAGAAWVFRRSGSTWQQEGEKLTGAGESGPGRFGLSVALSADGGTALIGASGDHGGVGAAWVFARSGSTWTQQGAKLVGRGAIGDAGSGNSVALSADGSTALVGGPFDDNLVGAAWVFARSESSWAQQGEKLTGAGETGAGAFGGRVALSADGDTALIGGPYDHPRSGIGAGAAWVFTRSGSSWTGQGAKLTGSGLTNYAQFGLSVALSADGDTALVGSPTDDRGLGAASVFTRTESTWTQLGSKLTAHGTLGSPQLGSSVALSADGGAALIGGPLDGGLAGSAWVFGR